MKIFGYLLFACFYYLFRILPIKGKKVFCIMTHDSSRDSNVGMVVQYLKKQDKGYIFKYLKKDEKNAIKGKKGILTMFGNLFSFFVIKPYHIATSEIILQDNIFLPFAYIRFSKKVKVIQLWHGTGSIKKIGQDTNTGQLKKLEYKANQTITHLIVNSKHMVQQYSRAFGIPEDKVYAYGLPRTDTLFQRKKQRKNTEEFYSQFPNLKDRKIILYAPTFRDDEVENPKIELDLTYFMKTIPSEYTLILKLHPHVAARFQIDNRNDKSGEMGRVYNLSEYRDLNTLMAVSDLLITDYSSIIFEYCLENKPMIFYAYDLEKFSDSGRGFYVDYRIDMPGPVVGTTEEVVNAILSDSWDYERIQEFKNQSYDSFDGGSTERVVENIIL